MDKAIASRCISTGTRVYYFDERKDRKGQQYLVISEIPTDKSPGKKKRQRLFVHSANIEKFAEAFNSMIEHMKNGAER